MDPVFKKLNWKAQAEIIVLNAPTSFAGNIAAMQELATLRENLRGVKTANFVLAFVTTQTEINNLVPKLVPLLNTDAVLWLAYPKGTSKRYTCDFNRDTGWQLLGDHDFEGVRQVAIDDDWSALRFRRTQHIKKLTRSFAMSEAGKARTKK